MSPAGLEPAVSAGERPQNYTLDRAATGAGSLLPTTDWQNHVGAQTLSFMQ